MICKAKIKPFKEIWKPIPIKKEAIKEEKKENSRSIHEEWNDAVLWAKNLIKQIESNND